MNVDKLQKALYKGLYKTFSEMSPDDLQKLMWSSYDHLKERKDV